MTGWRLKNMPGMERLARIKKEESRMNTIWLNNWRNKLPTKLDEYQRNPILPKWRVELKPCERTSDGESFYPDVHKINSIRIGGYSSSGRRYKRSERLVTGGTWDIPVGQLEPFYLTGEERKGLLKGLIDMGEVFEDRKP
jgi:hypothetical protein